MKPIKQSSICLSCKEKCCTQPNVKIPLAPKEAERVRALGYEPHEKDGLALMPSGYRGCQAYDSVTGRCNIYGQRPELCRLYPIKLVAVQIPTMYDATFTRFALVLDRCDLGKRMQLRPMAKALLEELQENDSLETLKKGAMQFNRIRRVEVEKRVRDRITEVVYLDETV